MKQHRTAWFAALATDIALGIYLVAMLHQTLWLNVFHSGASVIPQQAITLMPLLMYASIGALLGAIANIANASPGRMMFGFFDMPKNTDPLIVRGTWRETVAIHGLWLVAVLTVITAWLVTQVSVLDLFSREGLAGARRIFLALLTPEFSIIGQALLAIIETVYLALMATLLALPFAFVLSFFCASNVVRGVFGGHPVAKGLYYGLRFIANVARSIEPLVWAIVFSVWVGIGPFAGMLALAVHTIASLVKQYSEQIEDIDHGAVEAIESVGAAPIQVLWFAVVPQIVLPFLSFTIYRWDINVRMATVIGLVGGGGIGTLLVQYQGLAKWNEVGLIIMLIAAVVWVMDYASSKIRSAIR
jgi:phosphonate transport system permease protein